MKSSDITAALQATYAPPEWAIFFEVNEGTGARSGRRLDALAMNMWPSRGLEIRGMEIKVSKSDLARELKAPEKAEALARYCDTFYLVTPVGLTDGANLPMTWGHITVSEAGRVTTRRKATENPSPVDPDKSFVASLLRSAVTRDAAELEALISARAKQLREQHAQLDAERADRDRDRKLRTAEQRAYDAEQLLEKITGALGRSTPALLRDDSFISAVAAVHAIGIEKSNARMATVRDYLERSSRTIGSVIETIDQHVGSGQPPVSQ